MLNSILMEEVKETGGGGGGETESKTQQSVQENKTPTQEEGDTHDQFGYEKSSSPKEEGKEDTKGKGNKEPEQEKIKTPATGYEGEPPEVKEEKQDEKDDKKDDQKETNAQEKPEVNFEGLPKEEVGKITEFMKKHNVTKEVAQAFADLRKQEVKDYEEEQKKTEKQYEIEKQKLRASWHKELKEDNTFGGEKFAFNVHRAEKVLDLFMTNTKKELTERGSMLPPYVMRDLAKLADHLFSGDKLVTGDPKSPEPEKNDDPLSFYE